MKIGLCRTCVPVPYAAGFHPGVAGDSAGRGGAARWATQAAVRRDSSAVLWPPEHARRGLQRGIGKNYAQSCVCVCLYVYINLYIYAVTTTV